MADNSKKSVTDEIAALRATAAAQQARIDQLERAAKPPASPDPKDWQPYDPTARMSMPRSAMQALVDAVPDNVVKSVALRDSHAPQGPSSAGAIPSSQQVSNVRGAGRPRGWQHEIPIGPSMHQRYVDAQLDAQDAKDKAEGIRQEAQLKATVKLAEPKHG